MTSDNPRAIVYLTNETFSENDTATTTELDNLPIEERCGLEDIDTIAGGLLVLAPIDTVAEFLAPMGVRWERDIYDQTIQGRGLLVFQFKGHAWTGILDGYTTDKYSDFDGFVPNLWNWESQVESLSQKLNTRTIYYWCSDTSGCIGYACWENGTLMERLEYDDEIWQDTHHEALWDAPDRGFEPHLFESQLRQITATEIESAYAFVDDFLCEQQAYAATRFSAFNIKRDDLVRLDYIAFA